MEVVSLITARQGGRMFASYANFVNEIYVDTKHTEAKESEERNKQIIAYLFIQSLENQQC